jgi:hypothetical protein
MGDRRQALLRFCGGQHAIREPAILHAHAQTVRCFRPQQTAFGLVLSAFVIRGSS